MAIPTAPRSKLKALRPGTPSKDPQTRRLAKVRTRVKSRLRGGR